ncbi:hypothetical protein Pcinc_041574 [Petrolisthes cinctipes]|uniref:Uncharacterized protein n=1 Tax=Petrolisthes cinctipes TaxID=88211 RepID=A0AAE1EGT1_PETCI|nr:hypothetical protein Pcinc_041574 [Petrolisthes cinctipes]
MCINECGDQNEVVGALRKQGTEPPDHYLARILRPALISASISDVISGFVSRAGQACKHLSHAKPTPPAPHSSATVSLWPPTHLPCLPPSLTSQHLPL